VGPSKTCPDLAGPAEGVEEIRQIYIDSRSIPIFFLFLYKIYASARVYKATGNLILVEQALKDRDSTKTNS